MALLVAALAALLRICWVLAVPTKPVGDFAMYVESAAHLVEHGSLDETYVYMPGYVFLLAPIHAFGGGWLAMKLAGALLGGLGAWAVATLAQAQSGSRRLGLVAGLLFTFWPAGIAVSSVTGTDMPAAVLVVLAASVLVRVAPARPGWASALFGLLTGLAAYIRAIVVPLAALSIVVFRASGRRWREAAAFSAVACAVALAVLSPWAIRNRLRYGETFLTDSHGGLTALVGADPNTEGRYSRSLNRMFQDVTGFELLAEPHRQADLAALDIAKAWMRKDLAFTVGVLASKAERLLAHERALLYWPLFRAGVLPEPHRSFFARHRRAIEGVADGFYLTVVGLAGAGIAVAALRRRWLLLALLPQALALAALYTGIFAEPRYRLPIFMLLLPLAAYGTCLVAETAKVLIGRSVALARRRAVQPLRAGWRREGVAAIALATAMLTSLPVLSWAGQRLRDSHRWVVHTCTVDGRATFCEWQAAAPGQGKATIAGVWNGVGIDLSQAPSSTEVPPANATVGLETSAPVEAGLYAIGADLDIPGATAVASSAGSSATITFTAEGLEASPVLLASVAAASATGRTIAWRATLRHPGGHLRLRVDATVSAEPPPGFGRLWLCNWQLTTIQSPEGTPAQPAPAVENHREPSGDPGGGLEP